MRLTFVCSGNTCRSPLAIAAWSVVAREMDERYHGQLARVTVESAGLNARAGTPATPLAQLIAASWNADLSEHQARVWRPERRRLDKRRLGNRGGEPQLIVTMTGEQAAQVRFRLEVQPNAGEIAIEVLGAFIANSQRPNAPSWSEDAGKNASQWALDIPDPYGGSSEAYEECAARIRHGVRALIHTLCRD